MAFRFAVDRIMKGRAYPALSSWEARPYTTAWREFGKHWPWTTPLRIEEYCGQHQYPMELFTLDDYPHGCWYPICLGFFDFEVDYIGLLSDVCRLGLDSGRLRLLFMYHEGDNPSTIQHRLDSLCDAHGLPRHVYCLISSNTSADLLSRSICFHDFELWYHQRNIKIDSLPISSDRDRDFLCLNRVHKSWRASVVTDLKDMGILDNSVWSYCAVNFGHDVNDNPIQVDLIPQLRHRTQKFMANVPYYADDLTDDERNDHSMMPTQIFQRTYANIVMESQFDVDQSGGAFLTEKTFKPIKHGQLFFVVGAAGSLAALRKLGYSVFDHAICNDYDVIEDPTQRWLALRDSIQQAQQQGLKSIYEKCKPDLEHNQNLFRCAPWQRLNTLAQRLDQL